MLEPLNETQVEITVRKSRFIGFGFPAGSSEEVASILDSIKRNHADASHVVHAALTGAPASEIASFTDAGEPRGTAGRPVMEILRGSGVRNMAIVVVRYFGGTKLGTGGLVRAYGDTARAVLSETRTRKLVARLELRILTDYTSHDSIRRHLDSAGVAVLNETFGSDVKIDISLPEAQAENLESELMEITAGRVQIISSD